MESRLTHGHHQPLKLWLRMLSCTVLIETEIRTRLRNEFGITLPRFDLMAQLERHPEGLRMGELSKRMMVTGGNVTGIAEHLVQEKLVVRVPDANSAERCRYRSRCVQGLRHSCEQNELDREKRHHGFSATAWLATRQSIFKRHLGTWPHGRRQWNGRLGRGAPVSDR
jgi:DNA-binding MarR family transcriptional regulator